MRDYIRQIVEQYLEENIFSSAVQKKQSRGVAQSTGHAVELDMNKPNTLAKVKMAQDSKVVKGLITKGFTHAESSEGGKKVKLYFSGPRQRNTWLKKWRSLDIPTKTNESYKPNQPKPVQGEEKPLTRTERIRKNIGMKVKDAVKNMSPPQAKRFLKRVGSKTRVLDRGGSFIYDDIMNESYKYGGYMSRIEKGKRRLKRMKNIKAKRIEGERRRNKTRTETQREN